MLGAVNVEPLAVPPWIVRAWLYSAAPVLGNDAFAPMLAKATKIMNIAHMIARMRPGLTLDAPSPTPRRLMDGRSRCRVLGEVRQTGPTTLPQPYQPGERAIRLQRRTRQWILPSDDYDASHD